MAGKCLWPVNTGCFCRKTDTVEKNPREEHTAEQALTSHAPWVVGRDAWQRTSPCSPEGSAIAEGCPVNSPGYQDSRKGKSGVQTCSLITHLCWAWCGRGGMLNSTKLLSQAASAPLLQPEAGALEDTPVPGMGPHHTTHSRSGAALRCVLPGCPCSMEVAGRQSQLSAAPGAKPPKHKAQHFGRMNTSVSGRVCPRWILPAEAGGPAHHATGRNNPTGCPTFSTPASPSLQHVPPSNTRKAELSRSQQALGAGGR